MMNRSLGVAGLVAVVLAMLSGCANSNASSSRRVSDVNREAVRASFERWRQGTGGPFELLAPDAEWTIVGSSPMSKTYTSRQQFMDEVIHPFNARLREPLKPTVRGIHAAGDTVMVLFDGEAMAKDGVPYRNSYSWYLQMKDAMIVKATAFFDTRLFDEFWTRAPAKESGVNH